MNENNRGIGLAKSIYSSTDLSHPTLYEESGRIIGNKKNSISIS